MNVQALIEKKMTDALQPVFLMVENESSRHAVPENSQTHFKVVVVSDVFEKMSLLARHRLVNELLKDELAGPIHALALHTFTMTDWQKKNRLAPDSVNCMGGTK